MAMASKGEIVIVDDDQILVGMLTLAFSLEGFHLSAFADGNSFLQAVRTRQPACIILDSCMRDRSGLDLLRDLNTGGNGAPIFVISAQADIPTAVDAIRHGAFDFIEKPFDVNAVVARVREAIAAYARRGPSAQMSEFSDVLTPRECDVLEQIASGASNKEAGLRLGISWRTIEFHRARIIEKFGAKNTADLVRIVISRRNGSA
jgi:FixJ family two-component response regulator